MRAIRAAIYVRVAYATQQTKHAIGSRLEVLRDHVADARSFLPARETNDSINAASPESGQRTFHSSTQEVE